MTLAPNALGAMGTLARRACGAQHRRSSCCSASTADSAATSSSSAYAIRRWQPELDSPRIVKIWEQNLLRAGLTDLSPSLREADAAKACAAVAARLLKRQTMKEELAAAMRRQRLLPAALPRNLPSSPPGRPLPPGRPVARTPAQQRRQRRQRQWACLVAVHLPSQELAGYAIVSASQPEAQLPPPLPSAALFRAQVDGLAVAPQHRRQGVATQLLAACERLGRRWGYQSLWLQVELDNTAALQL